MTPQCDCEKMTCPEGCASKHTHKTFFCEKCADRRGIVVEPAPPKEVTPLEKQYWIDEKAEELDRLDYEEEIATRKGGIRTAVVVFDELRTALLEAHQRGAREGRNEALKDKEEPMDIAYENGVADGMKIGAQEERAKIMEWVKENEYCSKCCSPKKFCPDWGKHASAIDTLDLITYLTSNK